MQQHMRMELRFETKHNPLLTEEARGRIFQTESLSIFRETLSILAVLDNVELKRLSEELRPLEVSFTPTIYECNTYDYNPRKRVAYESRGRSYPLAEVPDFNSLVVSTPASPLVVLEGGHQAGGEISRPISATNVASPIFHHDRENSLDSDSRRSHSVNHVHSEFLTTPSIHRSEDGESSPSRFVQAFQHLKEAYGEGSRLHQNPANILTIIKAGDELVRNDVIPFLETWYPMWKKTGAWDQSPLDLPAASDSIMAKFIKASKCAKILTGCSETNAFKLRMMQVLLYHFYETLSGEIAVQGGAKGERQSTYVINTLMRQLYLEEWDSLGKAEQQSRRGDFHNNKNTGRKWFTMSQYFGLGILLISGKGPARLAKDKRFSINAIPVLADYVQNVYPKVCELCQMLNSPVAFIIRMEPAPDFDLSSFSCAYDEYLRAEESPIVWTERRIVSPIPLDPA